MLEINDYLKVIMILKLSTLTIDHHADDENAREFCDNFIYGSVPKYIFGLNEYAVSLAGEVEVDGFIDDFTSKQEFLGKPIVRIEDVPKNALVVFVVVIGRPFVAEKRLKEHGLNFLDYFSFKRYAHVNVVPVMCLDDFKMDFEEHRDKYDWVYSLLQDDESKLTFNKIINFRLSENLDYMRGFKDIQYRQYFENFLALKPEGEVFVDVGGFDGHTSLEFIKRCPNYAAIHIFEPESGNMATIKEKIAKCPRVNLYLCGLSNDAQTLRFMIQGSSSKVNEQGDSEIKVDRLDNILHYPFTFLKMDIEGGEAFALEGAQQSIINNRPRLAISVYHRGDDLWRIPKQVLSYHKDYKIYLRHYTEGVSETVMFFMP